MIFVAVLTLASRAAVAQEATTSPPAGNDQPTATHSESPRPWAKGVDERAQEQALKLFHDGNARFARNDYTGAIALYRRALAAWDHPAVHGNLAVALIRLKRPVEAMHELKKALAWGRAPLSPHIYQELITSKALLDSQLARVAVACRAASVPVTLDGHDVMTCPGQTTRYALAGPHVIVARKKNYLTYAQRFDAAPGKVTRIEVSLVPLADAAIYERRLSGWVPWTVVGAGAAVTLAGVLLSRAAGSNIGQYDAEIDSTCPNGCRESTLPGAVLDLQSRATLEDRLAVSSFILGGATLATGAALVYLNRLRRVPVDSNGHRLTVVPTVSDKGWAASLSWSF